MPLIERVVTIAGNATKKSKNLMIPIGTPIRDVLNHCGLNYSEIKQMIMGGPMMGNAQKNIDAPILKGTSGLLTFTEVLCQPQEELACIRCARCLDACPIFLNPSRLGMLVRSDKVEDLDEYHLSDCFECASCSFVCPSHIPLVQLMRLGKA